MSYILDQFGPEFVYGSIDGTITTFAVVAGAIGAGLSRAAILAIGISSLLADGYSMGVSSYLSEKTRHDQHQLDPATVSPFHSPFMSGIVTFGSFVAVGVIPLLPYLTSSKITSHIKTVSLLLALLCFGGVGYIRGTLADEDTQPDTSPVVTALESLFIGGSAAIISYLTGTYIGG